MDGNSTATAAQLTTVDASRSAPRAPALPSCCHCGDVDMDTGKKKNEEGNKTIAILHTGRKIYNIARAAS
jgi:hypothetical protein